MSSAPSADLVWKDARWLAQALDPPKGLVRVVEMDAAAYRTASFLDDRMLTGPVNAHLLAWRDIAAAQPADARRDARWIFHIGHVGSTLIARLLGELEGVLSVREPRILRDLTFFPAETRAPFVPGVQALLSRSFGPGEAALVKATSMVSEIAAELVPPGERALFMFASPENYVRGILAGENSREESRVLAETRAQRLRARGIALEDSGRSEAHLAAAAWACETTALKAASEAMPDRSIEWADFDRLLDDIGVALGQIASFFGFEASVERLQEIAGGPLVGRYSKALDHEYSPSLRRELLAQAGREHRADIDSALAMLARAAENAPLLSRALRRAKS
jgi:hypothetical protein